MRTAIILAAFLFVPAVAFSATIIVPDDQPTIQAAIDVALTGDTILVKPGTYVENIDFKGKAITVKGDQGSNVTVIDGNMAGGVVTFAGGETSASVLEGFSVKNGDASKGGGIYCYQSSPTIMNNTISGNSASSWGGGIECYKSSPTIINNTITGNLASWYGGGIYCRSSSPTITDNTITWNTAYDGGGIYCNDDSHPTITNNTISDNTANDDGGGIRCNDSSPTITKNTITGNMAGKCGGGISCFYASLTITENTIMGNTASFDGGGIHCWYSSPDITNNTISGNTASCGGGICCTDDSSPTITDNTLTGNTAVDGGGIYCNESTPFIKYNKIEGNLIAGYGGGISCYKSDPVIADNFISKNTNQVTKVCSYSGIYCDASSPLITNNTISENMTGSFGICGGIGCANNSTPLITCNVISGNKAGTYGGGIVCDTSSPIINSNIITGNKTTQTVVGGGAGIYCCYKAKPAITNNTITGNISSFGGGGICTYSGASPHIFNTIFWKNAAPKGKEIYIGTTTNPSVIPSFIVITYSDVQGGKTGVHIDPGGSALTWGASMIDADPLFLGPTNGDYHIPATSPCKDTGSNTATGLPYFDFEGDPRIVNSTVDMGADEFYTHLYYTGDATPGGSVELKFIDLPGASPVGFWIAFNALDTPIPGAYGDWWLLPPMVGPFSLPPIPPNGVYVLPGTIPASPPGPYTLYLQAIMGTPLKLTNLCQMDVE